MKLYGARYCDFVVWRKENTIRQRIPLDVYFISEAVAKIPSIIKSCILLELVGKWFTKPIEPSGDPGADIATDIDSEDSHSLDTVHCTTVDGEDHSCFTASTSTDIENDDFIDLALDKSLTVTDSCPDFDIADLQDDTANTSIADTTSNQQETSHVSGDATDSFPSRSALWCYCQLDKPEESMVGCDNPTCRIEWFHLSCLRLTEEQLPREKWFCPDCHKSKSRLRSKKKLPSECSIIIYISII